MFHYLDNDGVESDLTFQMRFYTPYTGIGMGSAGDPSGAYLFKPQNNISDGPDQSLPYSTFEKLEHYTSELVNCYTLYHSNAAGESYILFLRWFEDTTVLEWEVRMQGIPENKVDGSP